jgi:hypothetical protein
MTPSAIFINREVAQNSSLYDFEGCGDRGQKGEEAKS